MSGDKGCDTCREPVRGDATCLDVRMSRAPSANAFQCLTMSEACPSSDSVTLFEPIVTSYIWLVYVAMLLLKANIIKLTLL